MGVSAWVSGAEEVYAVAPPLPPLLLRLPALLVRLLLALLVLLALLLLLVEREEFTDRLDSLWLILCPRGSSSPSLGRRSLLRRRCDGCFCPIDSDGNCFTCRD